jgi:hypothetical protein
LYPAGMSNRSAGTSPTSTLVTVVEISLAAI